MKNRWTKSREKNKEDEMTKWSIIDKIDLLVISKNLGNLNQLEYVIFHGNRREFGINQWVRNRWKKGKQSDSLSSSNNKKVALIWIGNAKT